MLLEKESSGRVGDAGPEHISKWFDSVVNPTSQAKAQAVNSPKIAEANRALIRELLVESLAVATSFASHVIILAAADDDEAIIAKMSAFHTASKTAFQCARELRDLLESERRQP
jgi:hypothetical protein